MSFLPAEIQLKIITEHMSLDDLIAYAASNVINQNFFHDNRATIWKALYLRDVDSTPLTDEHGNGDDYRRLYLDWYNISYREYVKAINAAHQFELSYHQRYPDIFPMPSPPYVVDMSDYSKASQLHWHIMDIYREYRTRAGQRPDSQGYDDLTDEERENFQETVRILLEPYSQSERKALESFRLSISWQSNALAQALAEYWDYDPQYYEPGDEGYRSELPEVPVYCSDSGTEYFGSFLSLLPKNLWEYFVQPALTPERVKLLSVEPTFYENFGVEGENNYCVGDERGGSDMRGVFDAVTDDADEE